VIDFEILDAALVVASSLKGGPMSNKWKWGQVVQWFTPRAYILHRTRGVLVKNGMKEWIMRAIRGIGFLAALASFLLEQNAAAAVSGLTRVASGLSSPIYMTYAPGDRSRLFIVERGTPSNSTSATASIKILNMNTGQVNATPFLTISGIDNNGEGGLLGLAFDPNYQTNGKFYVDLTADDSDPNTVFSGYVRQYKVSANPDIAGTSFDPVISWGKPQNNHNGGWIGFSPIDHDLYIGVGDGGGGFDSGTGHNSSIGNGQDKTVLLGKMLRIDPSGDDFPADASKNYKIPPTNPFAGATAGADEVWAYGLRNPFRNSFDRLTGDLWIGDVGQGEREEIDKQLAGAAGGANYGWRLREGDIQTPTVGGAAPADYVAPVYSYTHPSTSVPPASPAAFAGIVVTGGYVYRGPDPSLQGKYFFFDSLNTASTADDNYWMFDPANPTGTVTNINSLLTANTGTHQFPVSYGEDAAGNLYIAYIGSGEIYRLATAHIAGDYDYDGDVDNSDYSIWRSTLGNAVATAPADGNGNGVVDAADYVIWRKNSGKSLGSGSGIAAAVPEVGMVLYLVQAASVLAAGSLFARRRSPVTMIRTLD
jgi:glucose/arabinose dehydrogenase